MFFNRQFVTCFQSKSVAHELCLYIDRACFAGSRVVGSFYVVAIALKFVVGTHIKSGVASFGFLQIPSVFRNKFDAFVTEIIGFYTVRIKSRNFENSGGKFRSCGKSHRHIFIYSTLILYLKGSESKIGGIDADLVFLFLCVQRVCTQNNG